MTMSSWPLLGAAAGLLLGSAAFAHPPGGEPLTALTAGSLHTCGLTTRGAAVCWGDNTYGQAHAPAEIFAALFAGGDHTCGLLTGGQALCWGKNDDGQSIPER